MGIIALDLGLRGATAALFLMAVLVILVRARPLDAIKLLAAAMAAAGAAYTIATAPFVPKSTLWWTLPILAGNPVVVWLWARATFLSSASLAALAALALCPDWLPRSAAPPGF